MSLWSSATDSFKGCGAVCASTLWSEFDWPCLWDVRHRRRHPHGCSGIAGGRCALLRDPPGRDTLWWIARNRGAGFLVNRMSNLCRAWGFATDRGWSGFILWPGTRPSGGYRCTDRPDREHRSWPWCVVSISRTGTDRYKRVDCGRPNWAHCRLTLSSGWWWSTSLRSSWASQQLRLFQEPLELQLELADLLG